MRGMLIVLLGLAVAPAAAQELHRDLVFHVKATGPGQGNFPAVLLWRQGGSLYGSMTVFDQQSGTLHGKYLCPVNYSSSDAGYRLQLTCSVLHGEDILTFTGHLNFLKGTGSGTMSDTYLHETVSFTVTPAK